MRRNCSRQPAVKEKHGPEEYDRWAPEAGLEAGLVIGAQRTQAGRDSQK